MRIKALSVIFCVLFAISLTACNPATKSATGQNTQAQATTTAATEPPSAVNPLSGMNDLSPSDIGKRPIAMMINNLSSSGKNNAHEVQSGVGKAEIVYETLAEGGVTRYLAVFSNIYKDEDYIGTIRSSRYTYAELALGHDALYVHCGSDDLYTTPFMKQMGMDDLDLGANASSAGERKKNGKAFEHTLYTTGKKLSKVIDKLDRRTDLRAEKTKPYFNFNSPDSPKSLSLPALNVKVKFSDSYISNFRYDEKTGDYKKGQGGNAQKDYYTGKQIAVKNVIVLFTEIATRPDNYHTKADLGSGSGYYFSNGTYTTIKWSKNGPKNPLSLSDENGQPLSINAGHSWICITEQKLKNDCVIEQS
ncbi:MAG: hypothetical protein BGN88_02995 [Clostridiales bacterium 43-6]|nr:MAG: hypothetical protein BGN88_02995 [Clostridiales bacterium 43-6]